MDKQNNSNGGDFLKPETPFLLIYTDKDGSVSYACTKSEDELLKIKDEVKGYGCEIDIAIEIESCREIFLGKTNQSHFRSCEHWTQKERDSFFERILEDKE